MIFWNPGAVFFNVLPTHNAFNCLAQELPCLKLLADFKASTFGRDFLTVSNNLIDLIFSICIRSWMEKGTSSARKDNTLDFVFALGLFGMKSNT